MSERTRPTLGDLQALDARIEEAEDLLRSYDPQIAEVDEPALRLEEEVSTTRSRLQEMKVEERRLELLADEKRARVKKLEERLSGVRNVREEAAVTAELDMVRRSLEGDEQEALTLIDQIRRLEERLEEQEEAMVEAKEEVGPRRAELIAARQDATDALERLGSDREALTAEMDPAELRIYEGIRGGGRRRAVAPMTEDGACGHCFSVIPLQLQQEIAGGSRMIRCEGCGVILTAARPEPATDVAAAEDADEVLDSAELGEAGDEPVDGDGGAASDEAESEKVTEAEEV